MLRWGLAGLAALTLTVVEFALIQQLVTEEREPPTERATLTGLDFIERTPETERTPEAEDRQDPPDPPPEARQPPPPEPMPVSAEAVPAPQAPDVRANLDFAPELGNLPDLGSGPAAPAASGGGGGGRERLVAIQRIPPRYPSRAARRGLEGWVKVEFTVDAQGRVQDPEVLDSEPSRVFDRAALRAIRRWRFKPATESGEAVSRRAVQTITFKLED